MNRVMKYNISRVYQSSLWRNFASEKRKFSWEDRKYFIVNIRVFINFDSMNSKNNISISIYGSFSIT